MCYPLIGHSTRAYFQYHHARAAPTRAWNGVTPQERGLEMVPAGSTQRVGALWRKGLRI